MIHSAIRINRLNLSLSHKEIVSDFTTQIHHGSRIALIGRNGCGKSTLLKAIQGGISTISTEIIVPDDVVFASVPQIIHSEKSLSGGESFNRALTQALAKNPNVLLLDEPTNHLDLRNRQSLQRFIQTFPGTLLIATHDVALLSTCVDTLWHIDHGKIRIFRGTYTDYKQELSNQQTQLNRQLKRLKQQKQDMHQALMQEQQRASKSRQKGEKNTQQRKWSPIVASAKASCGEETSGRRKAALHQQKQNIHDQLKDLPIIETITPTFSLPAFCQGDRTLVSVQNGCVGYENTPLLHNVYLSLSATDRLAIVGNNGSGKSTFIKALLNDSAVRKTGEWITPPSHSIGYLDQHYRTLDRSQTVYQTIESYVPQWTHADIRCHLNDFLFSKNEAIHTLVRHLSGGEHVRLCLAQIAADPPKLLILDEITNNLDLETRDHVIQVLTAYPGAFIVISHDHDFLAEIGITQTLDVSQFLASSNSCGT